MLRNLRLMKITSVLIYNCFDKNAKFLDYAGGYGIFTRLMRDYGFDFYWNDKYSNNLLAKGFEYDKQNAGDTIELISAFECFEHFLNPMEEIKKILKISKNILLTTKLLPNPIPNPDWWYYGLDHGQHISFYSSKTLKYIVDYFGLRLYSDGSNLHLITDKKINSLFFKFLIKAENTFIYKLLLNKPLKSKTFEDMNYLKSRL